nr:AAA family ATPase [Moritella viscosa]SHO14634.1 ORF10 [Moritella viscosa]
MDNNSYNKYSKGSEWRKWDLHLHTPYTNLNSYQASDESFINKLKEEGITAVALTNYYYFQDEEFELKKKLEYEGITAFFNLELRCSYTNNDDKCCDIHVIFSDDVTKGDLNKLLVKLNLNVGTSKKMAIDLEKNDITIATVEFTHLHDILNDETLNLKGRFLIGFMSRGHGNARSSSNFGSIYTKSDFLLHSSDKSGNLAEDREFWLTKGRPLFQSSDAHSLEDIGSKFSWIKADPTFEGLKQVIYEPEERIRLQSTKPDDKPDYQVIDSLELNAENTWAGKIEFNENLNTIIGGRSTGKSSLLASIAHKLGKFETTNAEYERYIIDNSSSVVLHWKDGEFNVDRDIDYFPQSYMYTLARDNDKRNDLVKGIVSKKDKGNLLEKYNSYASSQKMAQETFISTLFATQEEANSLKVELSELGDISGIEAEIKKLEEQINQFNSNFSMEEKSDYEDISSKILKLNNYLVKCDTYLSEFSALKEHSFFNEVDVSRLISHEKFQIEFTEKHQVLKDDFNKNWSVFVLEKEASVKGKITEFKAEIATLLKNKIYIKGQLQLTNNQAAIELSRKLKIEQEKLEKINIKNVSYKKKIEIINNLIIEISSTHGRYKEKAMTLSETLRFTESDLEVTVLCSFNKETVESILSEQLMQRSKEQKQLISSFCEHYADDPKGTVTDFLQLAIEHKLECKGSHTPQSVITQVLSGNTYTQDYELTYQNDNFQQMSQGKQAFVVLKLLLEFSDKTCPVLIDQPEDSLDNRAIYNELVKYLKQKKKDRQIILVTHNPNVVVSADAEQIIVANQHDIKSKNKSDLKFQYVTGGIEHSIKKDEKNIISLYSQGIRQHTCEVLEGGNEAFKKREQKYQLIKNS